jgi:hypothetical protein
MITARFAWGTSLLLLASCQSPSPSPLASRDPDEGRTFELGVVDGQPAELTTPSGYLHVEWSDPSALGQIQIEVLPRSEVSVANEYRVTLISGELTGTIDVEVAYDGDLIEGRRAELASLGPSDAVPLSGSRFLSDRLKGRLAAPGTIGVVLKDATECDVEFTLSPFECSISLHCADGEYAVDCPDSQDTCTCNGPTGAIPPAGPSTLEEVCVYVGTPYRVVTDTANVTCGWNLVPTEP